MSDCTRAEIRDLLPDLVAGTLSAADIAMVDEHVTSCAACAEELALIRVVRAVRPQPAALDVQAIVRRINVDHANAAPVSAPGVRSITSAPSVQRSLRYSSWRWAAAITLMAVGGLSAIIARRETGGIIGGAAIDTLMTRVPAESVQGTPAPSDSPRRNAARATTVHGTSSDERAALSVGELSEYSDSELEGVLKKLESWDGTASTDPLLPVPLVKPSGSTP